MRSTWKTALGFLLSGGALWLALRNVEFGSVVETLRRSDPWLFALSTIAATLIFPLRARRWQTILEPVVGRVPFGPLWRSTAIGMMATNVLPARAGEVARAYAITREVPRLSFTSSLASLAADRMFDAIVLLAMMFAAMLSPAFPTDAQLMGLTVTQFASSGLGAVMALLAVCFLAVLMPERVLGVVRAVAVRTVPKFADTLVSFAEHALSGLAVLRDARRFFAAMFWAVLHWAMHALALWLGFRAVGLDVPVSAAFFLQAVLGFASALPSSPGAVGLFELASKVGLGVYGVSEAAAVSWAIGFHVLTFIPITSFGIYYLFTQGLSLGNMRRSDVPDPE